MQLPTKAQYDEYKASGLRATLLVEQPQLVTMLDLADLQVMSESTWMALDMSLPAATLMGRMDEVATVIKQFLLRI
jgi:hypothetical protein